MVESALPSSKKVVAMVDVELDADAEETEFDLDEFLRQTQVGFQQNRDADIFVVSGTITTGLADQVINEVIYEANRRENVVVFLCTYGGDPDAAYRIAKTFKDYYTKFFLYVSGYCKSAGTIIALGADEVVLSPRGELGPLDVQLPKEDNFVFFSSGLDVIYALDQLEKRAFNLFEQTFLSIIQKSGGAVTTRTAANIAKELATGLLAPIASQIDPLKIGETQRAIAIAREYGKRLGASEEAIHQLIYNYPSHSFVIDVEEAAGLFSGVRRYSDEEIFMEIGVMQVMTHLQQHPSIRTPHPDGIVVRLDFLQDNDEAPDLTDIDQESEENERTEDESDFAPFAETGSAQQSGNGAASQVATDPD